MKPTEAIQPCTKSFESCTRGDVKPNTGEDNWQKKRIGNPNGHISPSQNVAIL